MKNFTKLNSLNEKDYKIQVSKKFFVEYTDFIDSNLFYNIPFEFESIKNDLLVKLILNVNNDNATNKQKMEIINNINNELCDCYSYKDEYIAIYISHDSFSSSDNSNIKNNKKLNKNLIE